MPPRKNTSVAAPATCDADDESEQSEEMSDPEDDIADEEAMAAVEFDTVRDAARDRLAERTRTQYDLFIGLMKVYFLSQPPLKHLVVSGECVVPLPINAVAMYLDHVESKRREFMPGKFKPVSPSYYRTVCRSLQDLYLCQQTALDDKLRLLLYSRTKAFVRSIANMKASGAYPTAPSRCISAEGYTCLCKTLVKATPEEIGGYAWHLVASIWSYVVLLWCLLARCDRVAQLRWQDFSWTNDALTVFIAKSKSDQCGDRAYLKKLFTSDDPATCPVLAVAVLFLEGMKPDRSSFFRERTRDALAFDIFHASCRRLSQKRSSRHLVATR